MGKIINFPSGMRMVFNPLKHTHVVAIGIYIAVGSSYEEKDENGISHFIEHMSFKGTTTRSSFDISNQMDSKGIQINAFTSKLNTCYYTLSTDEHNEECMEMLSDIFFNPIFKKEDMDTEKEVVIEEINMDEDDPDSACSDLSTLSFYGDTRLGRSILGSKENVRRFTRDDLISFRNRFYTADNVIISVAGNIKEAEVKELAEKYFEANFVNFKSEKKMPEKLRARHRSLTKFKDLSQSNIYLNFPNVKMGGKLERPASLVCSILGGGMSSRFFQRLREQKGLVYDISIAQSIVKPKGMHEISFATSPANVKEALSSVGELIAEIKRDGFTEKELNKAKEMAKTSLAFSSEVSISIVRLNGSSMVSKGKKYDIARRMKEISMVTLEDVKRAFDEIYDVEKVCSAYVGTKIDFNPIDILKEGYYKTI